MSYAGSVTSELLRSLIAGRIGYKTGEAEGGIAVAKQAAERTKEAREAMLAQAQAAAANRTASLVDPNDPDVLKAKTQAAINANIAEHTANRITDQKYPVRESSGGPGAYDKAASRMRRAYKAKLMAPTPQRFGPPRPGMSEAEAEELATEAWGPDPEAPKGSGPDTSIRSLLGGSILRGGGAATAYKPANLSTAAATSSSAKGAVGGTSNRKTSSAPANDPRLNVTGGGKKGNIDLRAAAPAQSAIPTGANLKERDMSAADLWDKKVNEGMTPDQATAYVNRLKGTG